MLIYFIFAIVGAIIVASAASARGRNGAGWFIYGLLIWPLALIHVLVLPSLKVADAERGTRRCPHCNGLVTGSTVACPFCDGSLPPVDQPADSRKCPYCAEYIKREAVVCRYCGRDVVPAAEQAPEIQ